MRVLVGFLVLALLLLQYRLWVADDGIREVWQLRAAVARSMPARAPSRSGCSSSKPPPKVLPTI
jgi:cell division protein FtsB